MKSSKITLYKNHANNIGYWQIWYEGYTIYIQHSQSMGGTPILHTEEVSSGKAGRTQKDQIRSRIRSRIKKQQDKGYVKTMQEAEAPPTNTLKLSLPMLATPLKRVGNVSMQGALLQIKYNGHRCLVTKRGGQVVAYSRLGHVVDTIDHILGELHDVISEGITIDGELYHHGTKLQTIGSWVKRKQEDTKKLIYVAYDVIMDEPFDRRLAWIEDKLYGLNFTRVAMTWAADKVDVNRMLEKALESGYEGLILRRIGKGYEAGRRSKYLVKIKKFEDAEFVVIDVVPSKDGWGILVCATEKGKEFRVSAPGTIQEKADILRHKEKYISKLVTVEYAEMTADDIPFHPVALQFREDI